MTPIEYRYYRVWIISDQQTDGRNYRELAEFSLYETTDDSGVNLAIGSTATASTTFGTGLPKLVIDNKPTTIWESQDSSGAPEWVQLRLPVAKPVRCFKLIASPSEIQIFKHFLFQGSDNGSDWVTMFEETNNTAPIYVKNISTFVAGVSKLSTGMKSSAVIVADWNTGKLLKKVIPLVDGSWSCNVGGIESVLVTHLGPSGYEPKSDGPITPQSW